MSIDLTKLPDPPRPSYTFTLFSRDLFDYDSLLESKLSRSQARVSHLASIFGNGNSIGANGNLTSKSADVKVPETTSTHYINGEYVASFTIGGEQIKSYLLIDTGSDLIWWQCKPCTEGGCYDQDDPIYNEEPKSAKNSFWLWKVSNERRVLTGGYSLPSQFQADIMSMCLPGLYSGSATISFHTTNFRNVIDGGCVVDTGTILTTFPRDLYNVFCDTFRQEVQDFPLVDDPTGGSDTCYKVDPGVSPHFPNVLMYFGNKDPDNVLILSQQRVVFLVRGLFCLALVRGMNASQL
ncbi:hypothetical protein P3S67_029765 [Capsicum chacoense]